MKRAPFILGLIFITVTMQRVADFAGGDTVAWLMAVALTSAVYVAAYMSDFKTTRLPALIALTFFIVVDGLFNLGETMRWSVETGRWDFTLRMSDGWELYLYRYTDFVYGIFPTISAAFLAWLAKNAEKMIISRKDNWRDRLRDGFIDWLLGGSAEAPQKLPAVIQEPGGSAEAPQKLPAWLPVVPATKREFQNLVTEGVIDVPADLTGAELARYVPVSSRSAQDWLASTRNGHKEVR